MKCSCDSNKYSIDYILSLSKLKEKRKLNKASVDLDTDSEEETFSGEEQMDEGEENVLKAIKT